jgi:catechol 2,3-dioxygenase-like lactoylglutathione lyase family enzyme
MAGRAGDAGGTVRDSEHEMKLLGLHHVAVIASDYERSKAFYTEVLGLAVIAETLPGAPAVVEARPGAAGRRADRALFLSRSPAADERAGGLRAAAPGLRGGGRGGGGRRAGGAGRGLRAGAGRSADRQAFHLLRRPRRPAAGTLRGVALDCGDSSPLSARSLLSRDLLKAGRGTPKGTKGQKVAGPAPDLFRVLRSCLP